MCDCHPLSPEDHKAWEIAKKTTHTVEEWRALHNAIEEWKRKVIDRHRGLDNK